MRSLTSQRLYKIAHSFALFKGAHSSDRSACDAHSYDRIALPGVQNDPTAGHSRVTPERLK
jgi:hypothetical protein